MTDRATDPPLVQYCAADQDGVAQLRLNRAAKLNALTLDMLEALDAHLRSIDADVGCRVLVLSASGEKAFCAGADIEQWAPLGALGMWRQWIRRGHQVFDRLATLRQPAIACIDGIAFGGGLELALACDLRFASRISRFALPEASIGTIPGWGGSQRLPRLIGVGRAKQMVFTAAPIDAATAVHWGLINDTWASDVLLAEVDAVARQIAANAPVAVQTGKQLLDASDGVALATCLESLASAANAATADAAEGLAAFRERRTPRFGGE